MEIELQLYRHEALHLFAYLAQKRDNLRKLKGAAADTDYVLVEWLLAKYGAIAYRIDVRSSKKPAKVKMPVSIARILWKSWQQELITPPLQLVLKGIDGQLKNKNLTPL